MSNISIIGAGLIGLSCAWRLQKEGWNVTIIDRQFDGDRVSHGNAGGIAVSESVPMTISSWDLRIAKWLLDPLGPLSIRPSYALHLLPWFISLLNVRKTKNYTKISQALASINNRVYQDILPMFADLQLSDHIHKKGALTVYETEQSYLAETQEWAWKRELGVQWHDVSKEQIRVLEPNLSPFFTHARMIEDWAHINDPKIIVDTLRSTVTARGAKLITAEVTKLDVSNPDYTKIITEDGRQLRDDYVLVANGAWGGRLAATVGDRVLIESERGYNTTLPLESQRLNREVIFADKKFVATPLAIGLRIGGAAEFAGLDAPANYKRSQALLQLARHYIPNMQEDGAVQWMGNRPTTADSLPVLGQSPKSDRLLYAFGHGHLGLTQSATTAELIKNILCHQHSIDMTPFSVTRFNK